PLVAALEEGQVHLVRRDPRDPHGGSFVAPARLGGRRGRPGQAAAYSWRSRPALTTPPCRTARKRERSSRTAMSASTSPSPTSTPPTFPPPPVPTSSPPPITS